MQLIIIMGSPGSGKGTISCQLASKEGFIHISTGKIFRALAQNAEVNQGTFVSDDITNNLVKKELEACPEDAKVILDGFPRTIAQAEFLDKHFKVDHVVYLDCVTDDMIVERLCNRYVCKLNDHSFNGKDLTNFESCPIDGSPISKRSDDTEEIIRKRIAVYHEKTMPVIKWYEGQNRLIRVDVSGLCENSYKNFLAALQL